MITLVETEEQKQELLRLCEGSAFGCKILGVVKAYGFNKGFACFWLEDKRELAFCLADDVMILTGRVSDPEETRQFMRVAGGSTVSCSEDNARALGLSVTARGEVLSKETLPGEADAPAPGEAPIREIFALLEETGMVEDFEPFYLDLSHRLRHGASRVFTEYREGELVGCAVVSAVGERAVILSALAVREDLRRQGIGRGLVAQVEMAFPGMTVYVLREEGEHQAFYSGLGYEPADRWVTAEG